MNIKGFVWRMTYHYFVYVIARAIISPPVGEQIRASNFSVVTLINMLALRTGMDIMTCRKDILRQIEELNK